MSAVTITKENFQSEAMDSPVPVLLEFWAPWCEPCKIVSPILDEIASERSNLKVGKINVGEQSDLATQFGAMCIPMLIIFKNGKIMNKVFGVIPKHIILQMVQEN